MRYRTHRIILAALVGVLVWGGEVIAAEIKDIPFFLDNFKGSKHAKFNVVCYQNGKRIVDMVGLFIREMPGKLTINHQFVDQAGNVVLLFLSSDTSCRIRQTGK